MTAFADTILPGPDDLGHEWYRERALTEQEPLTTPCPCTRLMVGTLAETLGCPGNWRQTSTGTWAYVNGCEP